MAPPETPDSANQDDAARAADALDRLAALHPKLIDLGLARTFDLLRRLANPHHRLPPTIHVAGTNGKGSVIAMMRAMAETVGLSTHVYVSPHLCRFNERIRLAGRLIEDGQLATLLEEVEAANEGAAVTFFEVTTAAAFLAFSRCPADLLLLETGLGGALDSTNVLGQPAATIITPIAHDHEHFLGNDLGVIAGQKAGIMRAEVPCFSAAQSDQAAAALDQHADTIGTRVHAVGREILWTQDGNALSEQAIKVMAQEWQVVLPRPSLIGPHQLDNAVLAASALFSVAHSHFPEIDLAKMASGLTEAKWPGRLQRLPSGVLTVLASERPIWVDGAHNAHGATALAASLDDIYPDTGDSRTTETSKTTNKWHFICGALNTRPAEEFLQQIAPFAASIHCIAIPDQPASLSAETLAQRAHPLIDKVRIAASVRGAIQAIASSESDGDSPIIICGSLYLAGHVLAANATLPD